MYLPTVSKCARIINLKLSTNGQIKSLNHVNDDIINTFQYAAYCCGLP